MGSFRTVIIAVVITTVGIACGTARSATDLLRMSADQYYQGIRWKAFTQAAAVLPPDRRAAFLQAREAERDIFSVLDYEIHSVEFDPERESAVVIVDYTWNRLPSTSLEKSRIQQHWQSVKSSWVLVAQEELELPKAQKDKHGADLL